MLFIRIEDPFVLVVSMDLIFKIKEANEIRALAKLRLQNDFTPELFLNLLGDVETKSDSFGVELFR